MRTARIIPCLDVDAGRVVKGVNFVDLREMGEPIELATRYSELGADELVFLDITASHEKRETIVDQRVVAIYFNKGKRVERVANYGLEDGKVIDFSGCQHPGDEQRNKGRPKDFIGFDEGAEFLESQVSSMLAWLRAEPGKRCRVVLASNPPRSAEGAWMTSSGSTSPAYAQVASAASLWTWADE